MPALRLVAVVLAGVAIAAWASTPPAPVPLSAAPSAFSAMRARGDLTWIAAEDHPTGSPANVRVRDRLIARLAELGLTSEIQHVENVEAHHRNATVARVTIENVIARVPGKGTGAHQAPLLLMCHYDSVPTSPGAADDGAGVASLLEIARILRGPAPAQHDIVLLFSDGEELGFLGADQFFTGHPLAKDIGAAVNLEARGGAGRAFLFETGPRSDELVRALGAYSSRIASASFATFVYDRMPNGTDFTLAKQAGIPGFNFAFLADPGQYHTQRSTPDALDLRSLQDIGDEVLASVRCLDGRTPAATAGGELAWSDLFGHTLVIYGATGGWLLLLLSVGLVAISWRRLAVRSGGMRLRAARRGPAFVLVLVVLAGVLLFLSLPIALAPATRERFAHLVDLCTRLEVALLFIAVGASMVAARLTAPADPQDRDAAWLGLLCFGAFVTAAVQATAPRLAPPFAWTLLVAALGTLALGSRARLAWSMLTTTLALGLTLGWAHVVFLGIGMSMPPALVLFVILGALSAYPLLVETERQGRTLGAVLVALGLAAALSIRFAA